MISFSIFVVDDESSIRKGISMTLRKKYDIQTFETGESALEAMGESVPDLVLLDIGLPGMSGIDVLKRIKADHPQVIVIMITAYEDVDSVVTAMKSGARDYITKPIQMDSLEKIIANALETIRLRKEVQALQKQVLEENMPLFIGESRAIHEVMDFVTMVAKQPDIPVLVLGETGTGKELIASAVHYRSPHFKGPLVTVNCASIPKDLVESELFGYTRGAFSGARSKGKKGLIEAAAMGTLFLDEVGDLSLPAQAKLLRFLEEGAFYKLGGTEKVHVKTRIISATNRDLDQMIANEEFRKDLYFRLSVAKVEIPSLNERPDDIMPLALYFLQDFSDKYQRKLSGFTASANTALLKYSWSGNVRELKNLIQRAALITKGPKVNAQDLGLEELERGMLLEA
ncbi:MAG: sigma-54 dependent transcriptional regulator [Desulfobacterales bacterium]|nr:sigma-54 dependent transcriptional regulator [Desulfobacterales bacterium]